MSSLTRPTEAPAAPAPEAGRAVDPRWSRRLAIGLPAVILLLVLVVANQTGTVLIARDLRADYEGLAGDAEAAVADAAASLRATQPAPAAASAAPAAAPVPERPATVEQVEIALTLSEFAIDADVTEVPPYAEVTFTVTNDGVMEHDAVIEGLDGTEMLGAGETGTFTVEAPASGELEIICTVPGHAAAGMATTIGIAGGEGGDEVAAAPADGAMDDAAMGTAVDYATPDNADAYTGERPPLEVYDPTAPPPASGTVHDIDLVIEERIMQVSADVWQEVWTFGGTVPGPTLRVNVGDTVNIHLINPEGSGVDHSVDFHASQVAWNDEMTNIAPGEEKVYSFVATHAGVWMYHCGTAPALHHIGNGMFGAIIVDPAEPLPEVDHEFVFVQSEWYTGPQGEVGDLGKMSEGAPSPDHVVFNGTAGQYADHPIEVGVGERVRAYVLNAGPNVDSSFHIVGTIFDSVMKEGVFLDASSEWGSQAIDLAPAQGGYAEFELAEDGLYPMVTHAFNFPGRGALGLFQAGDGGEPVSGGH
ncbi:multicopper oxidase domain-containing protein [Euzebya sp.]|uniref:multicopper oxidase domain-containing protein n=1 Tax=Euzebya sp. TaxID=1971409 RepID=UPI0035146F3C